MKKSLIFLLILFSFYKLFGQEWIIPEGSMLTHWAKEINPGNVLPEYPRPILQREEWLNLNGLWDYAVTSKKDEFQEKYSGKILVPFPIESALSGVKKSVSANDRLKYKRIFTIPKEWTGKRILLHFGAVDWEATVCVNNQKIGVHKGGYDSFTFDITEAITNEVEQELTISVWDPTDEGYQPKGKQTTDTHGFWYTAVTGIWQTVWLEPVNSCAFIKSLKSTTDIDESSITVAAEIIGRNNSHKLKVVAYDNDRIVGEFTGLANEEINLTIQNAKLWSPEKPFLYNLEVSLLDNEEVVDKVESYFGMRKISSIRDSKGNLRLALNNQIYFQFGLLDQGWWPDGLYRAPTDEALKYDIEVAKELGFNMLRKHGKMEPERWYYWCDKLGMLVWQDMTPGDITGEYGTDRTKESKEQFELEYSEMISQLFNYPSVVTWVIFNEGWGQYDTRRLTDWTRTLDPTRMINSVSGFMDKGTGDISDVHTYPGPSAPPWEKNRAMVLGEFGGLGYPVKGHLWNPDKAWGYIEYKNTNELENAYKNLINKLLPYISEGLSCAIYTQVSDVENETNGMMTYDRSLIKMDKIMLSEAAEYLRAIESGSMLFNSVLLTSQKVAQTWKYSFVEPEGNWMKTDFNDDHWKIGEGGFGDRKSHNPVVRTEWASEELWLRKEFNVEDIADGELYIKLFHQFEQSTKVYLNGKSIESNNEHFYAYTLEKMDDKLRALLHKGKNVIAVHCVQNMKQSYFDLGLFVLLDDKK